MKNSVVYKVHIKHRLVSQSQIQDVKTSLLITASSLREVETTLHEFSTLNNIRFDIDLISVYNEDKKAMFNPLPF